MKTKMKLFLAGLLFSGAVNAQVTLGTIKGQIFDQEYNSSIPNARVWIEGQGGTNITKADLDGKFKFEALKPGIYNLYSCSLGKDTLTILGVEVRPDHITDLGNQNLVASSKGLPPIVIKYEQKLIEKDVQMLVIKTEDIEHSPNIRNPKELMASMTSDIKIMEGTDEVIIRGSRPGDAIYYVDGVKSQDLNGVPGAGIGSMMSYSGGIPAKYGDTTGGVIVLETKSYFDLYYAWKARQ
ncbi:MAG: carboxypeptidase regulatory-like domain-containing protein [Crocinitomicaceae bacterium]|nr:carboxypeptidase regulatory-like domain-containing protein [Crocinitomicaceae bacterium]